MTVSTTAPTVGPVCASVTTSGRNEDIFGTRRVGLYRLTLQASSPDGGYAFDPRAFGFQGVVATVFIQPRMARANIAQTRYTFFYDYTDKAIIPRDATDSFDDAQGDDLSLIVLDVLVVGE